MEVLLLIFLCGLVLTGAAAATAVGSGWRLPSWFSLSAATAGYVDLEEHPVAHAAPSPATSEAIVHSDQDLYCSDSVVTDEGLRSPTCSTAGSYSSTRSVTLTPANAAPPSTSDVFVSSMPPPSLYAASGSPMPGSLQTAAAPLASPPAHSLPWAPAVSSLQPGSLQPCTRSAAADAWVAPPSPRRSGWPSPRPPTPCAPQLWAHHHHHHANAGSGGRDAGRASSFAGDGGGGYEGGGDGGGSGICGGGGGGDGGRAERGHRGASRASRGGGTSSSGGLSGGPEMAAHGGVSLSLSHGGGVSRNHLASPVSRLAMWELGKGDDAALAAAREGDGGSGCPAGVSAYDSPASADTLDQLVALRDLGPMEAMAALDTLVGSERAVAALVAEAQQAILAEKAAAGLQAHRMRPHSPEELLMGTTLPTAAQQAHAAKRRKDKDGKGKRSPDRHHKHKKGGHAAHGGGGASGSTSGSASGGASGGGPAAWSGGGVFGKHSAAAAAKLLPPRVHPAASAGHKASSEASKPARSKGGAASSRGGSSAAAAGAAAAKPNAKKHGGGGVPTPAKSAHAAAAAAAAGGGGSSSSNPTGSSSLHHLPACA